MAWWRAVTLLLCSPGTKIGFLGAEKAAGGLGLQPSALHTQSSCWSWPPTAGLQLPDFSLYANFPWWTYTCKTQSFFVLNFFVFWLNHGIQKQQKQFLDRNHCNVYETPIPSAPRPPSQRRTLLVDSSSRTFPWLTLLRYCFCTKFQGSAGLRWAHRELRAWRAVVWGFGGLPDRTSELAIVRALRYKSSPAQGH